MLPNWFFVPLERHLSDLYQYFAHVATHTYGVADQSGRQPEGNHAAAVAGPSCRSTSRSSS